MIVFVTPIFADVLVKSRGVIVIDVRMGMGMGSESESESARLVRGVDRSRRKNDDIWEGEGGESLCSGKGDSLYAFSSAGCRQG